MRGNIKPQRDQVKDLLANTAGITGHPLGQAQELKHQLKQQYAEELTRQVQLKKDLREATEAEDARLFGPIENILTLPVPRKSFLESSDAAAVVVNDGDVPRGPDLLVGDQAEHAYGNVNESSNNPKIVAHSNTAPVQPTTDLSTASKHVKRSITAPVSVEESEQVERALRQAEFKADLERQIMEKKRMKQEEADRERRWQEEQEERLERERQKLKEEYEAERAALRAKMAAEENRAFSTPGGGGDVSVKVPRKRPGARSAPISIADASTKPAHTKTLETRKSSISRRDTPSPMHNPTVGVSNNTSREPQRKSSIRRPSATAISSALQEPPSERASDMTETALPPIAEESSGVQWERRCQEVLQTMLEIVAQQKEAAALSAAAASGGQGNAQTHPTQIPIIVHPVVLSASASGDTSLPSILAAPQVTSVPQARTMQALQTLPSRTTPILHPIPILYTSGELRTEDSRPSSRRVPRGGAPGGRNSVMRPDLLEAAVANAWASSGDGAGAGRNVSTYGTPSPVATTSAATSAPMVSMPRGSPRYQPFEHPHPSTALGPLPTNNKAAAAAMRAQGRLNLWAGWRRATKTWKRLGVVKKPTVHEATWVQEDSIL